MRVSKLKLLVLMAMSALGIWASGTVLVIFYTLNQQLPLCPTGTFFGLHFDCGAVLSSPYSTIFGVPLELLAMGYFFVNLALVCLVAFGSERVSDATLEVLFGWRFIGILLVPYLMFVEFFIIHAICVYCTIMHAAIIADFIVISYLLFFGKNALSGPEGGLTPEAAPRPQSQEQIRLQVDGPVI
ncbi:MAG: vitamin K epoxide reductase family protein [Nitrososphaerota archaeon]|nr:vitamin K epoxide reductase family protein [Nitrososphaerota archaeon]